MSEEHARQFVYAVEQDAVLQQTIDTLNPATAASDIVKLGAERNLLFSVEEFNAALSSHLQPSDKEISEDELSAVSGGTHYATPTPNTNAAGVPSSTFWVKHGAFSSGGTIDIAKEPEKRDPIKINLATNWHVSF